MSELVLTLLRLSYLLLLWLLVLACIRVLRRDIFGTSIRRRRGAGAGAAAPPQNRENDGAGSFRSQPATLVVLQGPLAGTTLGLHTSAVLIGRSPACTLVVDDDVASGRHARIFPHDRGWYLEDLGSTNGTWLAGIRVSDPTPIPMQTPITIGHTVLELREQR